MTFEKYLASINSMAKFGPGTIPEDHLIKILEAARWCPSAENQQAWRFILVKKPTQRNTLIESVKRQDARIFGKSTTSFTPLTSKELSKIAVDFTTENYNAHTDPYRKDLETAHPIDVECAETCDVMIICCLEWSFIGKLFGELDMGAAILQILLEAGKLGYGTKLIRNFDRETLHLELKIPEKFEIASIIAIGNPSDPVQLKNLWQEEAKQPEGYTLEDCILDRRSIRKYRADPLPASLITDLCKISENIPCFSKSKPPYFELHPVTDPADIAKISGFAKIVFVKQAHVTIAKGLILAKYRPEGAAGFFGYGRIDLAMAIMATLLLAYRQGVGSCWIGAYNHNKAREVMQLQDPWRVESILSFGYPAEYTQKPNRLPFGSIVFKEEWNNAFKIAGQSEASFTSKHLGSLMVNNFQKSDTSNLLRERPAGEPLISPFKEENEKRIKNT